MGLTLADSYYLKAKAATGEDFVVIGKKSVKL